MKKLLLAILFSIALSPAHSNPNDLGLKTSLFSNKKKSSAIDKSRILFGPGFGFGAGARSFSINISPSVAYCLTENLHVGTTLGFNYFQQTFDYSNILNGANETYKYKIPAYSFSVYARYMIKNFLILGIEPEINNTKFISSKYDYDYNTGKIKENSTRLFIPSVLVGGGYAQRFSKYAYSYVMIMYDLVQNPNSRYYGTIDYRFGVMLNLWQ